MNATIEMTVRLASEKDIESIAEVHRLAFIRQGHSEDWIRCNYKAFPRYILCVAEINGDIAGYIMWNQKSGFRPKAVCELEQLAVTPKSQGQGIAKGLIKQSLELVKIELAQKGSEIKHIIVTTRADNYAQNLYRETLGAEIEFTISDLYSADEVLMIARDID